VRYLFPDDLGGGEHEALTSFCSKAGNDWRFRFDLPGIGLVDIPEGALTEVKPPLPEEPPVGSLVHLASDYGVYERVARGWLNAGDAAGKAFDWDTLIRLNSGDAPVRLVPDPFAEPVELPSMVASVQVSRTIPEGKLVFLTVSAGYEHLTNEQAKQVARALWAAAAAAEASP
jgi:hypothetical protein